MASLSTFGFVIPCFNEEDNGFVDAELQRLDPLTTLREREYLFLIDSSFPSLLNAHGVTLLPLPSTNS
jgi:hypothetical protein